MRLNGRHVLVLGLGESGLAVAQWCLRQGARVRVIDTRAEPPFKVTLAATAPDAELVCTSLAENFDKRLLDGVDLVVLSPGLSGGLMAVFHARAQGIPVVGEIELFAWALAELGQRGTGPEHARVLAITGTNGKTTTTTLTGHLCRGAGLTAGVAGNISPAALTALMTCLDAGKLPKVWVLELSSFQLETLESLDADAAAVLNISDDHLDRYIDLDEYASAKARVFRARGEIAGVQVLNRQDARVRRMAVPGRSIVTFGLDAPGDANDFGLRSNRGEPWIVRGDSFLLPVSELPISGLHNAANAMAALALCAAIDLKPVSLLPALRAFRGLPHRVEKIAEIDGVSWVDDSKGTNVGATVAAITGLSGQLAAQGSRRASAGSEGASPAACAPSERKVVVILGGDGKGQDFSPLRQAVAGTRATILIGRDGPRIGEAIAGCGVPILVAADLETAVIRAAETAQPGDVVLLSPACASFDMFRNYEHRAQVFAAAVRKLAERR